jgi:DNA helicase-2/ATP-dependent DNA helicase PcrA
MGYGRSVHNMLDYVHKHYQNVCFDDQTIKNIVDKYLYLPYGSPLLIQQMKNKSFEHLKTYIRNYQDKFPNILFSEKTIDYSIDEYLFIDGRIDLVRNSLDNTTTIVDFKSSSEVLSREQIKNQLLVYVLGFESLTGEKVDYIESYDFNKNDPTRIQIEQADKDAFKAKLEECHKVIHSSHYVQSCKDPAKGINYCKSIKCEFEKICCHK